jgi:hypothetical protein
MLPMMNSHFRIRPVPRLWETVRDLLPKYTPGMADRRIAGLWLCCLHNKSYAQHALMYDTAPWFTLGYTRGVAVFLDARVIGISEGAMMRLFSMMLAGIVTVLAACSPAAAPNSPPPTATLPPPTSGAVAPATVPATAAVIARPAWQSLALRDARTGAAFTLADFAGRTVYVHPMAKW